ncbi:MAG: hypothetical protein QW794_07905 [Thermosphaera sp.]
MALPGDLRKAIREEIKATLDTFIPDIAEQDEAGYPRTLDTFIKLRMIMSDGRVVQGDLAKYLRDKLIVPPGVRYFQAYSVAALKYPIILFRMKLPDWAGLNYDDGVIMWIGLENGVGGVPLYSYNFLKSGGANMVTVSCNRDYPNITTMLPADAWTKKYWYFIKLNENQVWFGSSYNPAGDATWFIYAYAVRAPCSTRRIISGPPYYVVIAGREGDYASGIHPFFEVAETKKSGVYSGAEIDLLWSDLRFNEGTPKPPLALCLWVTGTYSKFAGYSLSSGTLASHPIPVFGYTHKTLYFMADVSGSIEVQVYTLSGNWRVYDAVSYAAGKLWAYPMAGEALLARITYTPVSYPATVNEGEVVLS